MFTLRVLHGTPLFPSVLPQNTFPSSATMATSLSSSHKASYLGRGGGEGNVLHLVLQRVPLVTAALDVAGGSGCPCMCVGGGAFKGCTQSWFPFPPSGRSLLVVGAIAN